METHAEKCLGMLAKIAVLDVQHLESYEQSRTCLVLETREGSAITDKIAERLGLNTLKSEYGDLRTDTFVTISTPSPFR